MLALNVFDELMPPPSQWPLRAAPTATRRASVSRAASQDSDAALSIRCSLSWEECGQIEDREDKGWLAESLSQMTKC